MSTTKVVWTSLLGPLTAIVVFSMYRGITRDAFEGPATFPSDLPARITLPERSATLASAPSSEDTDARPATEPLETAAPASAAQEELAAMSETYRNTTFLIAIRQSGHVCTDMLGADQAADDVAAWRVRCSDALAYLIAVDVSGDLSVDPISYMEGRSFRYAEDTQRREPNSTRLDQLP